MPPSIDVVTLSDRPEWWTDRGHPLPLTGERTLPGIAAERYWFARHVAGYLRAAGIVSAASARASSPKPATSRGERLLDTGCGEGFGAVLLAQALQRTGQASGRAVVGLDLDPHAVAHAREAYGHDVHFLVAEGTRAPFPDHAFRAVVASQVIEHVWDVDAWLAENARVLAPDGLFVVSTPNRLTFSPPGAPPNPFHATEFAPGELAEAVARHFDLQDLHGVGHGPRLAALERRHGITLPEAHARVPDDRPAWLRRAVAATSPGDFVSVHADGALDLVAVGRAAGAARP